MMNLPFPLLVCILLVTRRLTGRQTWVRQPEYAEVNPGESVVLQCVINNKQGDCRSQTVNIQQGMSHKIFPDIYFVKCANVPHIPTRRRSK